MEQITYKLPVFEGPLDLLLNLIAKNKLNIYDIEISVLLEQYTEQIKLMQEEQMDIASEFLEMLEYQECKRIAKVMSGLVTFDNFCREPSEVDYDMTYGRVHNPIVLSEAYIRAVGRGKKRLPPPSDAFKGIVARRIVPVGTKIVHVLRMLRRNGTSPYSQLFVTSRDKSELVATFLAILELVKGKRIRVEGDGDNAEVRIIERKS